MNTSSTGTPGPVSSSKLDQQVRAVMEAARVVVALAARPLAGSGSSLTLSQMRVLTLIAGRGGLNLNAVAEGLGVHPSNATRTCSRLVEAGLVDRREDAEDRRNVVLTLTPAGRRLWEGLMAERRHGIEVIMRRMSAAERAQLASGMAGFARAAGDAVDELPGLLNGPH